MCLLRRPLHACPDLRLWQCRAASIDRGICLEAAAVGLRTRMVAGTRKAVPGGLEGAVYEVGRLCLRKTCQLEVDSSGKGQNVLPDLFA